MREIDKQNPFSTVSFKGYTGVACGTLRGELSYLQNTDFFDADKVLFTAPGLHEKQHELEKQLVNQLRNAKNYSEKIIVAYGERCFLDPQNPNRDIDRLIAENGGGISRIKAKNCVDMLASEQEREKIASGRKIYWLTPGWVRYWKIIFSNWDTGLANETFPNHDAAVVLDAFGDFDILAEKSPEKILEFSDWMKLGIEPYAVGMDRFKKLLVEQTSRYNDISSS